MRTLLYSFETGGKVKQNIIVPAAVKQASTPEPNKAFVLTVAEISATNCRIKQMCGSRLPFGCLEINGTVRFHLISVSGWINTRSRGAND